VKGSKCCVLIHRVSLTGDSDDGIARRGNCVGQDCVKDHARAETVGRRDIRDPRCRAGDSPHASGAGRTDRDGACAAEGRECSIGWSQAEAATILRDGVNDTGCRDGAGATTAGVRLDAKGEQRGADTVGGEQTDDPRITRRGCPSATGAGKR